MADRNGEIDVHLHYRDRDLAIRLRIDPELLNRILMHWREREMADLEGIAGRQAFGSLITLQQRIEERRRVGDALTSLIGYGLMSLLDKVEDE